MIKLVSNKRKKRKLKLFSDFTLIWYTADLNRLWVTVWPRPDLRSSSRSRSFRSCKNWTLLGLSPPPLWRGAQNWWMIVIAWHLDYSLPEPDFRISFQKRYHESSNFPECRYFTKFQWRHFGSAWGYSHMVGHAGSPMRIVYVDMTLTRSKVKVKDTGLLNFPKIVIVIAGRLCTMSS